MKRLRLTNQYKKDLRRISSRGYRLEKLVKIVDMLRAGTALSAIDDDHPLKGPWDSYRACHVQGDWVLIYRDEKDTLALVRTGTHSDLFE